MTLDEFRHSLDAPAPPTGLAPALEALWRDASGDFDEAHKLAQGDHSREGAWVHAYLHRKEGDSGNAAYWYRKAGRAFPVEPLESEWERIARALLGADEAQ